MRKDLTDITFAESGINTFIQKQKEAIGNANFTLVEFGTKYNFLYNGTPIQVQNDNRKIFIMRKDLTDITLVVDRSGSMVSCQSDAEGGINTFIQKQKEAIGNANFTLVEFDTKYNFLYNGTPIQDVGSYKLVPRGCTALLDAVGRTINEVGLRLDKLEENQKPGCVIFIIVTDGHENSSIEFTKTQVKEMIEHQQNKYNWHFQFLGADINAFDEGRSLGIKTSAIAQYDTNICGTVYNTLCSKVVDMRSRLHRGLPIDSSFSQSERDSMVNKWQ